MACVNASWCTQGQANPFLPAFEGLAWQEVIGAMILHGIGDAGEESRPLWEILGLF
jgi:hypothetical protein